jgi:hypothetical protein
MGERTRYAPGTFFWVGLATSDPVWCELREPVRLAGRGPAGRGAAALDLLPLGRGRRHDRGPSERARRRRGPPRALRSAGRQPRGRDTRSDGDDRVTLAGAFASRRSWRASSRKSIRARGGAPLAAPGATRLGLRRALGLRQPAPDIQAYLFGDDAAEIATRERPRWKAWMHERFSARPEREQCPARPVPTAAASFTPTTRVTALTRRISHAHHQRTRGSAGRQPRRRS